MRLDNLRPFDGTDRNKNKVPKKIMKEVMQHPKVKPYVISQFPAVNSQWVKVIVKPLFVAGSGCTSCSGCGQHIYWFSG